MGDSTLLLLLLPLYCVRCIKKGLDCYDPRRPDIGGSGVIGGDGGGALVAIVTEGRRVNIDQLKNAYAQQVSSASASLPPPSFVPL